jgi:hypothetical protein
MANRGAKATHAAHVHSRGGKRAYSRKADKAAAQAAEASPGLDGVIFFIDTGYSAIPD